MSSHTLNFMSSARHQSRRVRQEVMAKTALGERPCKNALRAISGCRESNPDYMLPKHAYYHYTTPRPTTCLHPLWAVQGSEAPAAFRQVVGQTHYIKNCKGYRKHPLQFYDVFLKRELLDFDGCSSFRQFLLDFFGLSLGNGFFYILGSSFHKILRLF